MTLAITVRRMVLREGQPLTLRRVATGQTAIDVAVTGVLRDFQPHELVGNIIQGDRRVILTNDEISAAGWPLPIRKGDQVLDGTKVYTVQGCSTAQRQGSIARHDLVVRG